MSMEQNVFCVNRTQKVLSLPPKKNPRSDICISSKQVAVAVYRFEEPIA